MEFSAFLNIARDDPNKSPQVVVVNAAIGRMDVVAWAESRATQWGTAWSGCAKTSPQTARTPATQAALSRRRGFSGISYAPTRWLAGGTFPRTPVGKPYGIIEKWRHWCQPSPRGARRPSWRESERVNSACTRWPAAGVAGATLSARSFLFLICQQHSPRLGRNSHGQPVRQQLAPAAAFLLARIEVGHKVISSFIQTEQP